MSLTVPTVTGSQPFWAGVMMNQPQGGSYSFNSGRYNGAYQAARLFKKRAMADARGALAVLIGAVAGTTATVQYAQRKAPGATNMTTPTTTGFGAFGGNIGIDTISSINRASTAADATELKKWFSATALLDAGITYPTTTGNSLSSGMQVGGTGRF